MGRNGPPGEGSQGEHKLGRQSPYDGLMILGPGLQRVSQKIWVVIEFRVPGAEGRARNHGVTNIVWCLLGHYERDGLASRAAMAACIAAAPSR